VPLAEINDIEPRQGAFTVHRGRGWVSGGETITVMRNEVLTSPNNPEDYILAIVEFVDGARHCVHYVRRPFRREPDSVVRSVNYTLAHLLAQGKKDVNLRDRL
jgi:hypothetical protein